MTSTKQDQIHELKAKFRSMELTVGDLFRTHDMTADDKAQMCRILKELRKYVKIACQTERKNP